MTALFSRRIFLLFFEKELVWVPPAPPACKATPRFGSTFLQPKKNAYPGAENFFSIALRCASRTVFDLRSNFATHLRSADMSLKLITGTRGPSKTKAIALAVFSGVRTAPRVALQIPVVAQATAHEVRDAWRESGKQLPNA